MIDINSIIENYITPLILYFRLRLMEPIFSGTFLYCVLQTV